MASDADDLGRTTVRTIRLSGWVHWCDPPEKEDAHFAPVPALVPGEAWICGCGKAYGVVAGTFERGPRWVPAPAAEVRQLGLRQ